MAAIPRKVMIVFGFMGTMAASFTRTRVTYTGNGFVLGKDKVIFMTEDDYRQPIDSKLAQVEPEEEEGNSLYHATERSLLSVGPLICDLH